MVANWSLGAPFRFFDAGASVMEVIKGIIGASETV
jgi:hypothetical protein